MAVRLLGSLRRTFITPHRLNRVNKGERRAVRRSLERVTGESSRAAIESLKYPQFTATRNRDRGSPAPLRHPDGRPLIF